MGRYILPELNSLASLPAEIKIITPSKAISSNLKVAHHSLESIAQRIIHQRGKRIASTLSSHRLLQTAVKEIFTISEEQNLPGIAKAYLSTIKDLFHSGIDLGQLECSSDTRIQQLGQLAIAYRRLLRQNNKLDTAELYWQSSLKPDLVRTYLFYGYFAPERDELALINAIAGTGSSVVLPASDLLPQNQQLQDWLKFQGWELKPPTSPESTGINHQLQSCLVQTAKLPPEVERQASLNVFSDLEAEARGILTRVKVLLTAGVQANEIVLVANDEQLYGETLMDLAWEYGLPLRVNYEIPLERTRIGAWLKLLLEIIKNNFPFEATAKLLSHPLAKFMSPTDWLKARQHYPCGRPAWQALDLDLGLDLSLLDLTQVNYTRQTWSQILQQILSEWEVLEKAKYWAREIVAFYRLQEALTELEQPQGQTLNKQDLLAETESILTLLTVPAEPGRGGVELHNPTSLLGTKYEYVFVLGAAEGILPTAIADEPILDFHSRKKLNQQGLKIKTAVSQAQRETFYFHCLLGIPRQQINFSYPERLELKSTLPSPYLSRLGLEPCSLDVLPLPSLELGRQAYLRQSNVAESIRSSLCLTKIIQAWQVEAYREHTLFAQTDNLDNLDNLAHLTQELDQYAGITNIEIQPQDRIFSASQLTQIGQCPFQWFTARLLQLKESSEAESILSAALRGSFYHLCLELALAEVKTAADIQQLTEERLTAVFVQAEQELNLVQLPGWESQRQEHLNLLLLNLASADFLPVEQEVVAQETKFETQWYGLKLKGQVDRIDRTAQGLVVIDYKTSGVAPAGVKNALGKANLDIQLAVYQDAIQAKYPHQSIDTAAYYSISKQKTISRPQKDPQALAAFATQVKSHLHQGCYPVAPDVDQKACRYCDYDLVCRFNSSSGDRPREKNIL